MRMLKESCTHDFPTESRKLKLENEKQMVYQCTRCGGHQIINKFITPTKEERYWHSLQEKQC